MQRMSVVLPLPLLPATSDTSPARKVWVMSRKAGASRVYMRCSTSNAAGQYFLARLTRTLREEDA